LPKHIRTDDKGKVRVIADAPTFRSMAGLAFDQIRRYGTQTDATIPAKMLDVIAEIAEGANNREHLNVLREHVLAIAEDCDRKIASTRDREIVNAQLISVAKVLKLKENEIPLLSAEQERPVHSFR
jgi:uncharacterized membrane protein